MKRNLFSISYSRHSGLSLQIAPLSLWVLTGTAGLFLAACIGLWLFWLLPVASVQPKTITILHVDPPPDGFSLEKPRLPLVNAQAAAGVCDGDGVSGMRVQVLYVHQSDVASQLVAYEPSFQTWLQEADTDFNVSAQQTGGTRHIRFVHDANCIPSILEVTLSVTGTQNFGQSINELYYQGFGQTDRNYLMFADARVYCGISSMEYDDQPGPGNRSNLAPHYARVDAGCWSGVIPAHELMHNLGGVQWTAPHSDGNAHCTENYDNMCDHSGHINPIVCPDPAGDSLFDCHHDDYYFAGTPPADNYLATHWNTANSYFLIGGQSPAEPCVRGRSGKPCK